jgi:hypothetical protein
VPTTAKRCQGSSKDSAEITTTPGRGILTLGAPALLFGSSSWGVCHQLITPLASWAILPRRRFLLLPSPTGGNCAHGSPPFALPKIGHSADAGPGSSGAPASLCVNGEELRPSRYGRGNCSKTGGTLYTELGKESEGGAR